MRTELLKTDTEGIEQAAATLRRGGLVAFPTETVYGLGADARRDSAVLEIFRVKGRPADNPLIVHVRNNVEAGQIGRFDALTLKLAEHFWPGPMTLVLPLRQGAGLSRHVLAGHPTVAIRVPSHSVARALLEAFDGPVAAPSANLSSRISPTRTCHVVRDLGGAIPALLDGGDCQLGIESTILAASTDELTMLRPGAVTAEEILQVTGIRPRMTGSPDAPGSPGQLPLHYAPASRLRLRATDTEADEISVGFGPDCGDKDMNLSLTGDLNEAAANLYAALSTADEMAKSKAAGIAVSPIPDTGLGRAINDRLRRGTGNNG
ncbi:MAG: L-threonylcarbamoyladenylate synthase [Rhodobacteraceae bacterium]|nr:L-threonylcarbamoyladenylate synthase [Paracoccaceae bacterium]